MVGIFQALGATTALSGPAAAPRQQEIAGEAENPGAESSQYQAARYVFGEVLLYERPVGADVLPLETVMCRYTQQRRADLEASIDDERDERRDAHVGKGEGNELVEPEDNRQEQHDDRLEPPEWR